ncbi:MAG: rRNA (guanine966-N2)-methyltransferase [Candidatus Eremiobacteraeota bacterium]|jgi:16S rRNA (guanine(966)-N(2))-methyltransferase RsmD|nr:rRNA (guanine966-N2)-methyltransferase [Candidatus Eremiobacteraeota bacterium]
MGTLTITGGTLRSRRVPTPPGRAVRPTPARVKEALFSILGSRVDDARVLDLFAGTGALGFESLSRGAAHVTFVEKHRPTADALRASARALGIAENVEVIAAPAERAVSAVPGRFDLVFADPPYANDYPQAAFATLRDRRAIDDKTTVVYEHSSREPAPADPAMRVERTERYGEVVLEFMRPLEQAA